MPYFGDGDRFPGRHTGCSRDFVRVAGRGPAYSATSLFRTERTGTWGLPLRELAPLLAAEWLRSGLAARR